MSKITRKYLKAFGIDGGYADLISIFGSFKAGNTTYSDSLSDIQSLDAWGEGLAASVLNNAPPTIQDMNAVFYLLTTQLRYIMQNGISEYDATTTYYIGSLVTDSTGAIYRSVADDNAGNALSNTQKWCLHLSTKERDDVAGTGFIALAYDDYIVNATGTTEAGGAYGGTIVVTLPIANSYNKGRIIAIRNMQDMLSVSLIPDPNDQAQKLDGSSFYLDNQITTKYGMVFVISNGSTWDIIQNWSTSY